MSRYAQSQAWLLEALAVYLPEDRPPAWREVLGVEQQLKNKKAA